MSDLNIPEAAYTAGEAAILGYRIADSDLYDVASDAINAAAPIILTTKLTEIATKLEDRHWAADDPRAGGMGTAIGIVLDEIRALKVSMS